MGTIAKRRRRRQSSRRRAPHPGTTLVSCHRVSEAKIAAEKPFPLFRTDALAGDDQIDRLRTLALLVRLDIEADALTFDQRLQPRTLDRGDVHKHIATAIVRFDETVSTLTVKKFDRTGHCHRATPSPWLLRRRPPRRDGLAGHPHGARLRPHTRPQSLRRPPTGGGTSKPATDKLDTFFACGKVGGYRGLAGHAPFRDEPVGPAGRLRREKSAERGH